jgi:hypothetical protein
MRVPVCGSVPSDDVALRVDSITFSECRTRNVDGGELSSAQDKPMLVAVLAVVEAHDVSFRIDPGDPRERGIRNVDGAELPVCHLKTVEHRAAVNVGAHDSCRIEGHGRERSLRARLCFARIKSACEMNNIQRGDVTLSCGYPK